MTPNANESGRRQHAYDVDLGVTLVKSKLPTFSTTCLHHYIHGVCLLIRAASIRMGNIADSIGNPLMVKQITNIGHRTMRKSVLKNNAATIRIEKPFSVGVRLHNVLLVSPSRHASCLVTRSASTPVRLSRGNATGSFRWLARLSTRQRCRLDQNLFPNVQRKVIPLNRLKRNQIKLRLSRSPSNHKTGLLEIGP